VKGDRDALLSAEETDALLSAMQESERSAPVEPIDLGSPERRVRGKLLQADRTSEALAHALGRAMLRHTETLSRVEVAPAEIIPFGTLVSSLLPTWSIARLETDDGAFALAIADDVLTSFILDRRLGAPLASFEAAGEDRLTRAELSPVDRRVLGPVFVDVARSVADLGVGEPDALRLLDVLPNAHALPPTPELEPLLMMSFTIQPGSAAAGHLRVVLDASAARRLLPAQLEEPRQVSDAERALIRERVMEADVEVVAVLGEALSTIGDVLALDVGDVVRLDAAPHSPVMLRTDDRVAFYGKPCVHHGNLAVRVTQVCSATEGRTHDR